ncbi:hypothetical protein [uncultured Alistipes sp.]|uniref:hypothetical protein n=1 Tax=uncultured Alistipes sp. TaxID=538949 RepID=UPI0025D0E83E|nr:hypothetical protein [uncultured Alistipes sp.]
MKEKKKVSISELQSAKARLEQTISDLVSAFAEKYGLNVENLEIESSTHVLFNYTSLEQKRNLNIRITIKI